MGAVSVLRPHDLLGQHPPFPRLHPSSPLNTPPEDSSSVNCPKPSHQTRRRRNSRSVVAPSKTTPPPPPPHSSKNLVMGQVKILRRGEALPVEASKGLLHLPPDEFVQIQSPVTEFFQPDPVRPVNGFYAGSAAFVSSPPPSLVPLPGFFTKRGGSGCFSACDSATSDLRRILRLD